MVRGTPSFNADVGAIGSHYDYGDRSAEFRGRLDVLDSSGVTVVNPTSLLRWSMHEAHLADLAVRGVQVAPRRARRGAAP